MTSGCQILISIHYFNNRHTTGAKHWGEYQKIKMASKETYELKRKRLFIPQWKNEFTWVDFDGTMMHCLICRMFPSKADKSGSFYTGTDNIWKQSLTSHASSRQHLVCVSAKRVVDNPSSGPLTMLVRHLNVDAHRIISRLITTAYHEDRPAVRLFPPGYWTSTKKWCGLGDSVSYWCGVSQVSR